MFERNTGTSQQGLELIAIDAKEPQQFQKADFQKVSTALESAFSDKPNLADKYGSPATIARLLCGMQANGAFTVHLTASDSISSPEDGSISLGSPGQVTATHGADITIEKSDLVQITDSSGAIVYNEELQDATSLLLNGLDVFPIGSSIARVLLMTEGSDGVADGNKLSQLSA